MTSTESTICHDLERFQNINQRVFGLLPSLSNRLSIINSDRYPNVHQSRTPIQQGKNILPDVSEKRNTIFPTLVDEDKVFSLSNRYRRVTPPSSSRSVELPPSKSRGRLRKRASSIDTLPSLPIEPFRTHGSLTTQRCSNDLLNETISNIGRQFPVNRESDSGPNGHDNDDNDNAQSPIVSIDPFPNVESFLQNSNHEIILKPRAPTPPKRKPKKKKKDSQSDAVKKQKARVRRAARRRQWIPPVTAATRRRDQEVARRHPIRKQFVYSELIDEELKSYIPKRQPGGKLKPIYKRNNQGEILMPETPIEIAFEKLSSANHEGETAASINRRRKEELQALLQRRKKLLGLQNKKRRKRVRFRLPKDHVPSDSADDDTDVDSDSDMSGLEEGHDHEGSQREDLPNQYDPDEVMKMNTNGKGQGIEATYKDKHSTDVTHVQTEHDIAGEEESITNGIETWMNLAGRDNNVKPSENIQHRNMMN